MASANVATPLGKVVEMQQRAKLPRTLMGGTEAMRKAGKTYLPQEPAESEDAYKNRLERSVLYNVFGRAVRSLTGKILEQGVNVEEDTPEEIKTLLEDCDLEGHDLEQFVNMICDDAMEVGLVHVLVDYPLTEAATGKVLSKYDEQVIGARPYLVHLPLERIIGWRLKRVKGKNSLAQLRIRDCVAEPDGEWGEKEVDQIRVLEPGKWQLWRKNAKDEWFMYKEGITTIQEIPLVTFYTRYVAPMIARPPLEDLAHLNVCHWQSLSDQRHITHVARVPLLFGTGFDEDGGKVEIGPNRLIKQPTGATLGFVEHTGSSIKAGADDLAQLEQKMAVLAMEPQLNGDPGAQTATGRVLDTAEAQSTLGSISGNLEDSVDQMFVLMAKWMNQDGAAAGGVGIDCDFSLSTQDATGLQELGKTRLSGDISREAYLKELKRRGILSQEYDIEADKDLIDEEVGAIQDMLDKQNSDAQNQDPNADLNNQGAQ